ncbi:MAG: PLP-dependent transferase, partial [Candidatus Calescibacterium sp.]|nr:PLP-dependent transferase [Candidatus Calescibacterium sp.]
TYVSILSGIISSLETQSPSFFYSSYSSAGRFTGTIRQSINDYYRDQHTEGRIYEQYFKKEYIDVPCTLPLHVFATSSGMSALTTIVGFIQGEEKENRPVFVGESCYFEEKFVVQNFFSNNIIEINEDNIQEIEQLIKKHQPIAIFLDSLSNSSTITQPDMTNLLQRIKTSLKKCCYVVIDNTCLSITYQPFLHQFLRDRYMRIVVWESLLKHHQFGLDKVNGGIIYTNAPNGGKLYTYRDHLGTNISDTQAISLPNPNRKFLLQRLLRHERNTKILVEKLLELQQSKQFHHVQEIVSPLSPSHKNYTSAKSAVFHGGFITLKFYSPYNQLSYYKRILKKAFFLAKQQNIPLVGGTSFGFPITRLYIPASRPGQGTPFLRIAVGTEPLSDFLRVTEVLINSLKYS